MPTPDPTPAMLSANLYVPAGEVKVRDLSPRTDQADTVSLWFGNATGNVQVLGTIAEVTAILRAATDQLAAIAAARQAPTVHPEGGR